MAEKSVPGFFREIGSNKVMTLLSVMAGVLIIATLIAFVHVNTWQSHGRRYLNIVGEQRVLAQQIANYTLEATRGRPDSFALLTGARDRFDNLMNALKSGDAEGGLPASPGETREVVRIVENLWLNLRETADLTLDAQGAILKIRDHVESIGEFVPGLQQTAATVVEVLSQGKSSAQQIFTASRQMLLGQRIENNVDKVLQGGAETAIAIDRFARDSAEYGAVLQGLLRGDQSMGIDRITDAKASSALRENALLFSTINDNAQQIIQTVPVALPALEAAEGVTLASDQLSEAAANLSLVYEGTPGRMRMGNVQVGPGVVVALGAISLAVLTLLAVALVTRARRREQSSDEVNRRNQQAILRLLDEMGDLASGDLTVQATVTEDITGAIADSINYAIEALRSLVNTINSTSDQVSSSAQESRAMAMHLAEASEHQSDQINAANMSIQSVAQTITQMSEDAAESAEVAQRSVEIASTGAQTVRSTIYGMDQIREQIQETSKRIKRLGESSQQIGEIVELIDDISDQTNILALNAAMQAAMAGEAGRGFAVVADEVQRLAERSSNATKQIEALVKTIQADTNEAVASMEESTAGVVRGAKLAENAGDALLEIETVSNRIAELTGNIARRAKEQAAATTAVSETMSVIQEITMQTSEGTGQTAASIGTLADLADDLQQSVSGFKLPA
ncbi:MAG: type IV pili methyl-accepting chemotaxis transducer N-terminal domain-containing protein [Chromatiales bacterium]|nr:type IV pili methyl-accepting chemotaxis transducer N-terminal domain-containing protein [Chromatiales bacterium]